MWNNSPAIESTDNTVNKKRTPILSKSHKYANAVDKHTCSCSAEEQSWKSWQIFSTASCARDDMKTLNWTTCQEGLVSYFWIILWGLRPQHRHEERFNDVGQLLNSLKMDDFKVYDSFDSLIL